MRLSLASLTCQPGSSLNNSSSVIRNKMVGFFFSARRKTIPVLKYLRVPWLTSLHPSTHLGLTGEGGGGGRGVQTDERSKKGGEKTLTVIVFIHTDWWRLRADSQEACAAGTWVKPIVAASPAGGEEPEPVSSWHTHRWKRRRRARRREWRGGGNEPGRGIELGPDSQKGRFT